MKGVFILLVVVCSAFATPTCPKENPLGEDVLLSAEDCQHFYKCDNGKAYLMECPANEEWGQELQRCDWPEVAQCTLSSSSPTQTSPTPTPSENPSPTPTTATPKPTTPAYVNCPQENPIGEDVLLPAPDCQHFYKCDHGKAYLMPCPANQEWSQELKRCDWPEVAQCTPSSSNIPNPKPTTSETTSSISTPKPTSPPNVSCPPENPEGEDVLLPAEDCQHFYKCDHGKPTLQECPENLEWSQELQQCDWPEVAQCTPSSNTTSTAPSSSTDTPTVTTPRTPTSKPTTPKNPSNICPSDNGEYETLLPIPGVCDKFYKCDFGDAKVEDCPPGTKFSHIMLRCDFPDVANCVEGVTGMES
ncbi:probable chitinase 10 [Chrysoperla carnea]|uniref:probable chitinase 10 n=1 Tax=Chrysoperla carnea TaxID=189513 RepID=UPI001D06DF83|nr:probable chitinase 10 [Chrysoperla carnea]